MIRRPPRSTRTDTLLPSRRSSDLDRTGQQNRIPAAGDEPGNRIVPPFPYRGQEKGSGEPLPLSSRSWASQLPCGAKDVLSTRRLFCRSEEHTSELQSLMRISYAVFCLKKKNNISNITSQHT